MRGVGCADMVDSHCHLDCRPPVTDINCSRKKPRTCFSACYNSPMSITSFNRLKSWSEVSSGMFNVAAVAATSESANFNR